MTKLTPTGIFAGLYNSELSREVRHKYCVDANVCTCASEMAVLQEDGSRLLLEVLIDSGHELSHNKSNLNIAKKPLQGQWSKILEQITHRNCGIK